MGTPSGVETPTVYLCPVCGGRVAPHTRSIGQCAAEGRWVTLSDAHRVAELSAEVAAADAAWRRYSELAGDAEASQRRHEALAKDARATALRYAELTEQARQYLDYQRKALADLRAQAGAPPALVSTAVPLAEEVSHAPAVQQAPAGRRAPPVRLVPATELVAPDSPPPAQSQQRSHVPTAVLMQGTGALMILAASVLVFGIAWTILPAGGQATLMVLMVIVLGGITVGLRHKLPTTSLILAWLTAAVLTVVAAFLPTVAGFNFRWYPTIAALVVTAALAVAGRLGGVSLWRHLAWPAGVVAIVLFAQTLVGDVTAATGFALRTVMWAAGAVALLAVAARLRRNDDPTAESAYGSGLALSAISAVAAAVMLATLAVEPGGAPRLLPATAIAALAIVLVVVRPRPQWGYALLPLTLAIDVLFAPAVMASPLPSLVLPALVIAQSAVGFWWWQRSNGSRPAVAWMVATFASPALVLVILVANAPVLQTTMAWLTWAGLGLTLGTTLVVIGWRSHNALIAYSGVAVASLSWTSVYVGQHLPGNIEYLTMPVLAGVALTQYLMRGERWPVPTVLVASVLSLPSYASSVFAWLDDRSMLWGSWTWWAGTLTVAAAVGWTRPPSRTVVAAVSAIGVAVFAGLVAWDAGWREPELYVALAAATVGFVLTSAQLDGYLSGKYTPALLAAGVMLSGAYFVALFAPIDELATVPRRAAMLLVLIAVTIALRRNGGWWSVLTGWAGLLLAAVWWVQWLAWNTWAEPLEVWTVPLGILATVGVWLASGPARWPRWSLLLPAGAVALASAAASVVVPLGRGDAWADLRVVLVLGALWAVAVMLWSRPRTCAVAGGVAIALTWYQFINALARTHDNLPVEVFTWSAAVAVAAATTLAVRAAHKPVNTTVTMAPTVTLVLIPTAMMAWALEGAALERMTFVLVAGGVLVVVGAVRGLAGLLFPALAAILVLIGPVLLLIVPYIPVFVPLTIVGVILLVAGARVERLRIHGRHLANWATHLH